MSEPAAAPNSSPNPAVAPWSAPPTKAIPGCWDLSSLTLASCSAVKDCPGMSEKLARVRCAGTVRRVSPLFST